MRELATQFVEGREQGTDAMAVESRLERLENSFSEMTSSFDGLAQTIADQRSDFASTDEGVPKLRTDIANCVKFLLMNGKLVGEAELTELDIDKVLNKAFGGK